MLLSFKQLLLSDTCFPEIEIVFPFSNCKPSDACKRGRFGENYVPLAPDSPHSHSGDLHPWRRMVC